MRPLIRLLPLIWLCAAPVLGQSPTLAPALAPLLDGGADRLIARVEVPSAARKVGEVRLLRRGDADVVQTLLYTKVLSQVVGEIRKKELANWPPGNAGNVDAVRYADALDAERQRIWSEQPKDEKRADRRQKMLIEFVLDDRHALVALGTFDMDESGEMPRLTARRPRVILEPARDYVQRNMHLIAADSFGRDGAELDALLGPLDRLKTGARPHAAPEGK